MAVKIIMLKLEARLEERRQNFLKSVDQDTIQHKRDQFAVELRRTKRLSKFNSKRVMLSKQAESQVPKILVDYYPQLQNPDLDLRHKLTILYNLITSSASYEVLYKALLEARKVITSGSSLPIVIFAEVGYISVLVNLLECTSDHEIKKEAAWCIANMTSGDHFVTRSLVEYGAVEKLIRLIDPYKQDLLENVVWALANIAGDCQEFRDYVNSHNLIYELVGVFNSDCEVDDGVIKTCAWAIQNCVKNTRGLPDMQLVNQVIHIAKNLIRNYDEETQNIALWILSEITNGESKHIAAAINSGVMSEIMKFLEHSNSEYLIPALRTCGNIVSGDAQQTQTMLNYRLLDYLQNTVDHQEYKVRKETYWTLSNITAGTKSQISYSVSQPIMVSAMKGLHDPNNYVRREASWVYSNITEVGPQATVIQLVHMGILTRLSQAFQVESDAKTFSNLLRLSRGLLKAGSSNEDNFVVKAFCEVGCLDLIESLQLKYNERINQEILGLIEEFYGFEEEQQQPVSSSISQFEFS
mmetsp:Transcript_4433/g.6687  ORF Transcript_4433/g.6687 Transcript_4433/m.6687 type:complete len:525 (-) Transcript_4433:27-1601(-)